MRVLALPDEVSNLKRMFNAAVAACHPSRVVPQALPPRPKGRVVVIGAGKASAAMAAAVEDAWGPPLSGIVVTRYGHGVRTKHIEVVEAGHPLPDAAGVEAATRALNEVRNLTSEDLLLVLLSGGGSALLSAPLAPLTLGEKQDITRGLVLSGASIHEINCVRKHLSAVKGGRLAALAYPARVVTLAISDVANDDFSVIASGPTVADSTTRFDALQILERHRIDIPKSAVTLLLDPASESIKADDLRLANSEYRIVARAADALAAACDEAQRLGYETKILGVNVEGEAREIARIHGEIVRHQTPSTRPLVLLSGGELTLKVTGDGRGGPNREYLLSLAQSLQGLADFWALAGDTDGIDGNDDVAGGWITPDTSSRAKSAGIDIAQHALNNDSGGFFSALGQELITGPTRTNVNDFRSILIAPSV